MARVAALLLPALVLGLLVAGQWQSQRDRSEVSVRYNTPLAEAAGTLQAEQGQLKAQLADLRARLDAIQASAAAQGGTAREVQSRVDELKARAGLTSVSGDGVTVVLDDSRSIVPSRDVDRAICHATDLTDILNAGWRGGARAIAVNDERIIGTSSVYCVGSTIMVNGRLMSPPFNLTMLGAPDGLLASFDDPSQLRDIKQRRDVFGLGFRVSRGSGLRVPAYDSALTVRHAQPR